MTTIEEGTVPEIYLYHFRQAPRSWEEWLDEFKEEARGKQRWFVAESMLYYILDNPNLIRDGNIEEAYAYLLELADARLSNNEPSSVREKLVGLLATKFFDISRGNEDHHPACLLMELYPDVHCLLWSFLSFPRNLPSKEKRALWDNIVNYVARMYEKTILWQAADTSEPLREAIRSSKPHVVQALVATGQLNLTFEYRDTSKEMIAALSNFALMATMDHPTKRVAERIEDVLAFGWGPKNNHRLAASVALSLMKIRDSRQTLANELRTKSKQFDL